MATSALPTDESSGSAGILAMLRAQGGRVTVARRATIDVLLAGGQHRHLTAEEIAEEVGRNVDGVAESTVYRTLSALEDLGVVTHVHLGHGPSTYHLSSQTHRHLVCRRCNRTIEVPAYEFSLLASQLDNTYGFRIADEHFALVGECADCRPTSRRTS